MKSLYYAAHVYMIVGLVSGLAYREVTKIKHFTGETQLGLVHTHVLALGMLFFLVVAMMVVHGTQTVSGRPADRYRRARNRRPRTHPAHDRTDPALRRPGQAGVGHHEGMTASRARPIGGSVFGAGLGSDELLADLP